MAKLRIIHDKKGETLTVYFSKPTKNQICEETGDGIIVIKDKKTKEVVGFEKLYFKLKGSAKLSLESI